MLSKEFRGEIWTNVDWRVVTAMVKANAEAVDGCVGDDSYSLRAISFVQQFFSKPIYATFTINGTGANIIALKAMLDSYSSIICAEETHVSVYEAGAFEYTLGNKILTAESMNGKLTVKSIEKMLHNTKKYKYIPKVIVLTQPTELGTLYTVEELKEICDYAHSEYMYVYIDGARIASALAAMQLNLTQMMEEADVDAFSIGGTKAGAMFGEMVVFRKAQFGKHLPYIQKQSFQHFDKSKFLGVQFDCLFRHNIWLENAQAANEKAIVLRDKFLEKGIEIYYPVEANMVFAVLNRDQLDRLLTKYDLHYWNEELKIVRFAATANTKEEEIQALMDLL